MPHSTPDRATCPNCNQPVTPADSLCSHCGALLSVPPPLDTGRLLTGAVWLDQVVGFLLVVLGIPLSAEGIGVGVGALTSQSNGAGIAVLIVVVGLPSMAWVASSQNSNYPALAKGLRGGLWFWLGMVMLFVLIGLGAIVVCLGSIASGKL